LDDGIELKDIEFKYRGKGTYALRKINLSISAKSFYLLIGPSGCGKSTLLRVINGLIPNYYHGNFSGKIYLFGKDITGFSVRERTREGISTVLQFPEDQVLARKVWRNVAFGPANFGLAREEIIRRAKWALKQVDMIQYWDHDIMKLSSGQKQKIILASALAMKPKLLLLDEPTSQMDPVSAENFAFLLKEINESLGVTILLVEHRFDEFYKIAHQVILMNNGNIVKIDSPLRIFYTDLPRKLGVGEPKIFSLIKVLKKDRVFKNFEELEKKILLELQDIESLPKKNLANIRDANKRKNPVLSLREIWYKYKGNKDYTLKDINLDFYEGEFIAIVGKNGSGKTTLAKIAAGIIKPKSGVVSFKGKPLINSKKLFGRRVIYCPQNPELMLFNQTVYDEIAFGLKNLGFSRDIVHKKVDKIMRFFGLSRLKDSYPLSLSGGEKLRVAIASLLVLEPDIMILDEPTRGLDWSIKLDLVRYLKEYLKTSGSSIVLISHDVELLVEVDLDRVVLIDDGKIIMDSRKEQIFTQPNIKSYGIKPPVISTLLQKMDLENIVGLNEFASLFGGKKAWQ